MAKTTVKRKKSKTGSTTSPEVIEPKKVNRRAALGKIGLYALTGIGVTAGAGAFALDFRKKLAELDLSVIGQGTPVILQIHDPQCRMCMALQSETRTALKALEEGGVHYRVANIRTDEGAAQQSIEGLPHVTLVFYDGSGKRVHVIQGVTPADEILRAFQQYLGLRLA